MNKKFKTILIWVGVLLIFAGIIVALNYYSTRPTALDGFAKCLTDKGAKFYGTFWCPHCQNQKAVFGRAQRFLPYIECSTPDQRGQLQICTDNKIEGYPTWEFADGSRETGEVPLEKLAEKTGCTLPEGQ